ncbi:uncharacterized protein A1O9_07106, partial [Exophiala aquamarina CBS 119918]
INMPRFSLKPFIARVLVSPPTTSLAESTAIVKHLQVFGHPAAFSKASHPAAQNDEHQQEFDLVYLSSEQLLHACSLSPITIRVNHDLPDPRIVDPYNVRGLQDRRRPSPKAFVCRVSKRDNDYTYTGQNSLSGGFAPSNMSRLYQSLQETQAPVSLTDAFGASPAGDGHLENRTSPAHKEHENLASLYRDDTS